MNERGNSWLRHLDAFLGIPLLFALGLTRRRRLLPKAPRSIGILRTSCIGDTILLSAIVEDLRAGLPEAKIRFFAGETNYETARLFMRDDEVIRISATRPFTSARNISAERVDVLMDFGPWPRVDALIAALSGARCTVGFRTKNQRRHYCYDIAVQHSAKVHELDNYRALAKVLGICATRDPRVLAGEGSLLDLSDYVVFHMWPGGYQSELREWPAQFWQELAEFSAASGFSVVLTGVKSDRRRNEQLISGSSAGIHDLAGKFNLAQTSQVLQHAAAVVSVNTGIMHLAAALGTPTIGLSGPTSVARWGAVGREARNLAPGCAGCGYLNLGFEYAGQRRDCMEQITVKAVSRALQEAISARSQ